MVTASTQRVRDAMTAGQLDVIATPTRRSLPDRLRWIADNGCFTAAYPGDDAWIAWLGSYTDEQRSRCLFAVAPDVVGDAAATGVRSAPWLPVIRDLGYPAAFVAQDGLEDLDDPWEEFDALFIGGSTEWKLGRHARELAGEAKARGKWVHMGRVNSARRFHYAATIGCDSADGTKLAFGPHTNLPAVLGWVDHSELPSLFDLWRQS